MKKVPRFNCEQVVQFIGGQGKIKAYRPESGSWQYMVEMEMGPEPDMGRIGYETTVVLLESDLVPA